MPSRSLIDELDACKYLFLAAISEPEENSLRLLVQEGLPAGGPQTLHIGSGSIQDAIPIDVIEGSRSFEILWPLYISYAVRNESYCSWDKEETWEGAGFRIYTRSKFLDFVCTSTFASPDYPGSFRHYEVLCANHVIDVASTEAPRVRVIDT